MAQSTPARQFSIACHVCSCADQAWRAPRCATELRLRGFLVRDATGRQIHDARLLEVAEGEAVIDGDPASPDYAALARLVAGQPGITGFASTSAGIMLSRSRSDRTGHTMTVTTTREPR